MSTKIKGAEYPLSKIFSSAFDYEIPSYQRPYAWSEDETAALFDDLYEFYQTEQEEEQYFLGSIVLVKEDDDNKPHAEVIDGQQRLTTLTILFAAMASKLQGKQRDQFAKYINEPGDEFENLEEKPRVRIRKRDNDFFRKYVQSMDFEGLLSLNPDAQDTEAKCNIIKNAKLLMNRIDDKLDNEEEIRRFGSFLVQRCYLVAVSTPTQQAAFRIFSVMNSRGMSLLATDIIKADMIGSIRESRQEEYNSKWEDMEVEIGRNGFNDLFGHIRMIFMKSKAKHSLQQEFYENVITEKNEQTAVDFIDNILSPYSEAYRVIKYADYEATHDAEKVNDILHWLNRIDNSDWVPVAMAFFVKHKDDPALLNRFLRKLERLAAFMRANSWDVNSRVERHAAILSEIESGDDTGFDGAVELTSDEIQAFLTRLNSDIYTMVSNKRNYLILRLDSFVADGAASYDSRILTIEHVLPQTVSPGSEWEQTWPDEGERKYWLHKIGNLIPLTKRHNSQAQNYNFAIKKEKYFTGKAGTTSYALASQVLNKNEWTPEIVKARQDELIEAYRKNWELY